MTENVTKNNDAHFSSWRYFSLKSFISGLIIVALFSLAVSTFALFTCSFTQPVYEVLPPWKKKKHYERPALHFCSISFLSNVIVFVYNGLKQNLILETKLNRFLQISFFHRRLMFISKKHLALYVEKPGHEFCRYIVTFVCISYFVW